MYSSSETGFFLLPPPPPKSEEFAALTIASISNLVMSPTYRLILEPSLELCDVVIFFDKSGNASLNCARSFSET